MGTLTGAEGPRSREAEGTFRLSGAWGHARIVPLLFRQPFEGVGTKIAAFSGEKAPEMSDLPGLCQPGSRVPLQIQCSLSHPRWQEGQSWEEGAYEDGSCLFLLGHSWKSSSTKN